MSSCAPHEARAARVAHRRNARLAVDVDRGARDDGGVRRSIDHGFDDHPGDDEDRPTAAWAVALAEDCDACADARVVVTVEERGRAGSGLALHLAPATARRLRVAIADALKEMGEQP